MPLLEQVLEKYPDDVKIVFKNFPLRNHKFAMKASTAALAAESQGKFWEFHDLLFKYYNKLDDQKIREIALGLDLDQAEFEKKMKDPKIKAMIRQDVQEGTQAGVRGTPTIFINGKRLRIRSLKGFQAVIDKELQKLGKKAAKPALTKEQVRDILISHVKRLNPNLKIGQIKDNGGFYETEILSKDKEVVQILGVDKHTGRLILRN